MRYGALFYSKQCTRRAAWGLHVLKTKHGINFPPDDYRGQKSPDQAHYDGEVLAKAICEEIVHKGQGLAKDIIFKHDYVIWRKKADLPPIGSKRDMAMWAEKVARGFLDSIKGTPLADGDFEIATTSFRKWFKPTDFLRMLGHIEALLWTHRESGKPMLYFISVGESVEEMAGLQMIVSKLEEVSNTPFIVGGLLVFNRDGVHNRPPDYSELMKEYANMANSVLRHGVEHIEQGNPHLVSANPSRGNCRNCEVERADKCDDVNQILYPITREANDAYRGFI